MSYERLKPELTTAKEQVEELKRIVPEAFADGKINWQTLKEALGEHLEDEGAEAEHFGLFWPGKREARRMAATPSKGTLVPVPGEGIDEETTRNIFVEGENLEVLKLLQKSYAGRIKMIYIDPPYNTGNDFVYEDDFREPLEEYLRRTGQVDEESKPWTTNTRADGRFHSKWLSMIYPRLRIARNLLRDDGLIFCSIDDGEGANLRVVMNEIFGEENFLQQIVWKNKYGPGAQTRGFGNLHEYILCYSKTPIESISAHLSEDEMKAYKNKDAKFAVRGGFVTQPLATKSKDDRPNLVYPIVWKEKEVWPDKQWIWSKDRMMQALENDELVIREENGRFSVRFKQYLKDENGQIRKAKPLSLMLGPFNQDGTAEIRKLFGKDVFDFPKPAELIKFFFSMVVNDRDDKDGIYLDFVAGSGTSAQALMELNKEDQGNRTFICVQMAENCETDSIAYKEGFRTIAEIATERIRRVSKEIKKEIKAQSGLFKDKHLDLGFKIFRLSKSNHKIWQDYDGTNLSELEAKLDLFETPLVDGWKPENLLTEILLLEGFPLDSKIEKPRDHKKNTVHHVSSEFCEHRLLLCLDKKIEQETIQHLKFEENDVFVCLDSALTDQDKMRLADVCKLKTI